MYVFIMTDRQMSANRQKLLYAIFRIFIYLNGGFIEEMLMQS